MSASDLLIEDVARDDRISTLGTGWRPVTDRVMGGVSRAALEVDAHADRRCLRLTGDVRLDNDGGFVQMALDLAPDGTSIDARPYAGVRLVVSGNDERYGVHLRTADVERSWQSYRAGFDAGSEWREVRLPFTDFVAHRIERPFDRARLRRIGLVAIGRAFFADLRLAELALYR